LHGNKAELPNSSWCVFSDLLSALSLSHLHSALGLVATNAAITNVAKQYDLRVIRATPNASDLEERIQALEQLALQRYVGVSRELAYMHRTLNLEMAVLAIMVRISESEHPGSVPEDWEQLYSVQHLDIPSALDLAEQIANPNNNAAVAYLKALRTGAPPPSFSTVSHPRTTAFN
jgi:hypothetical protein